MVAEFDAVLTDFDRDGYAVLPGFLRGEELAELQAQIDRYVTDVVPTLPAEEAFFNELGNPASLSMMCRLDQHDDFFAGLDGNNRFGRLAEKLLGGPVVAQSLEFFDKPPEYSKPTPPHQDGYYFMLEPCEALTFWLSLDESDEETGCLRYVPGSYRDGVRPHGRSKTLGFSQSIIDYAANDCPSETAVPAKPGDLLVHHALCIHRADENESFHRHRRSLGLVYYSKRARQDTAQLQAYQQKLNKELSEAGKI
jgi:phytanoyl-CoA hydroxylase